jgi:hypothetical protein
MQMHADLRSMPDGIAAEIDKTLAGRHLVIRQIGRLETILLAKRLESGQVARILGRHLLGARPDIVALGIDCDEKGRAFGSG